MLTCGMPRRHERSPERQSWKLEQRGLASCQGDWGRCSRSRVGKEKVGDMDTTSWVWSWGAGTHGQLGSGDFSDRLEPFHLTSFLEEKDVLCSGDSSPSARKILALDGGGAHAVALVGSPGNVQVMTWGNGESGALGHGDNSDLCLPKGLSYFEKIHIRSVSAGWSHSAFVTDAGDLYTCGAGSFGQLGHGDLECRLTPTHVMSFTDKPVLLAVCGMRHTLVLQGSSEGHAVYAFGSSKRGQLGTGQSGLSSISHRRKFSCPQRLPAFEGEKVMQLVANGDHSAALTESGCLYLWGRGFRNMPDVPIPSEICFELRFSEVALGWNHCIALAEGQLWAWGSNDRGQIGSSNELRGSSSTSCSSPFRHLNLEIHRSKEQSFGAAETRQVDVVESGPFHKGPDSSQAPPAEDRTPRKHLMRIFSVTGLDGKVVKSLSAGAEHSAAVLEDGTIVTWGWGEHGQLGHGDDADQLYPKAVAFPMAGSKGTFQWRTFCGSGFTFAVAEKNMAPRNER